MQNLKISYLYRDVSNYKRWAEIVVENPAGLSASAFETAFIKRVSRHQLFADVTHFKPEDFGWPTAYFEGHNPTSSEDMDLHELNSVELTQDLPTCKGNPLEV
jgi:hypothetical protein